MLRIRFSHFAAIISLLFCASLAIANTQAAGPNGAVTKKADRRYVSVGISHNEFKDLDLKLIYSSSIDYIDREEEAFAYHDNIGAHTYSLGAIFGWYLTDTFKTEWRLATGIRDDKLKDSYEVDFKYIANWYIGVSQPITDYMSGSLMVGLSYYEADITHYQTEQFRPFSQNSAGNKELVQPSLFEMEEGLFGTNFSMSWMLNLDYKLNDQWYLTFEYGRLLKDTDSTIEVHQYSTYLKYEF